MSITDELRSMAESIGLAMPQAATLMMGAADAIEGIESENANLRELVKDMCDFFCVVPDEPHAFKEEIDFSVEVWKRMRELGIEEYG